jgi:O-antigen biosynthesis protein
MTPANPDAEAAVKELPLLMVVDQPVAGATFSPGGELAGLGWVLCRSSVAEISVSAGEKHLGYADYGLYRPDLAEAFPQYPNVDHGGFSFSTRLDLLPAESVTLAFSVRTVDGEQYRATVPIHIAEQQPPHANELPARSKLGRPVLELKVDRAVIGAGGELQIVGWAVAHTALEYVRVYSGETLLGSADLGHARPDVAKECPDYANALTSGFSLLDASPPGSRDIKEVRIEAAAQGGIRREVVVAVAATARGGADANILFHCDHIWLSPAGRLVISGWSTSPLGVRDAVVLFDGVEIGKADLGLSRPDLALAFPAFAQAAQAGFEFTRQLPEPSAGEHVVSLTICTGDGAVRVFSLPVTPQAIPPDVDNWLRLHIDSPAVAKGTATQPVGGALRVEGWALARAGVGTISTYIDDAAFGEAHLGLRREDVAAAHRDWNDALLSGFGISIPGRRLSPGQHSVQVVLRDRLRRERSVTFVISVDPPAETGWPNTLRTRMPPAEVQLDRLVLSSLGWEPRFELYMPVREPEIEAARITLAAFSKQEYANWQLIALVDQGEGAEEAGNRLLAGFHQLAGAVEVRIRGGSQAFAEADARNRQAVLRGLIRPGDRLGPDALLELAIATGLDQETDFIYCDERRIDPVSGKMAAYFKPNWSPELLLSTNYIGRLWLVRPDLLRRSGIDLGQPEVLSEYEMVLRLTRTAHRVAHLPKVLCERGPSELDDAERERAALKQAAMEMGVEAEILPGCAPGIYRFKRRIRQPGLVSIIIPTCGVGHLIRNSIASIQELTANQNFEIVCIENIPEAMAGTRRWVNRNANKTIAINEPFNWSRFNNVAAWAAGTEAEYLLFLNDDIEVFEPDWLNALLEHGQCEDVGVTGALLLYPDRTIQHAAMQLVAPGLGRHSSKFAPEDDAGCFGRTLTQRNVIAVTGACMLIRRTFFDILGGFDEAHSVINNDLDLCLRSLDRGKRVVYTPYAKLIHHEMASRKTISDRYDVKHFERTWRGKFAEGDPYYNPFLSRVDDHFTADPEPVNIVYSGHPILNRGDVRSILALKLDHIGDFVTAFPAFRRLKERFPHARLYVLASTPSARMARLEPSIDEVIEFNFFHEKSSLGQMEVPEGTFTALRQRLAALTFDVAIDLRKHPDTRDLLRLAGAKVTAGFDSDSRFGWLDVALEWEKDSPLFAKRQHVSDDTVRLVEAVAVACEHDRRTIGESAVQFWRDGALANVPESLFTKPVVCIHPASGNPLRTWPAHYFAELIDLLIAEFDVNLAIIGGEGDRAIVAEILSSLQLAVPFLPGSVVDLAGRIPLEQLPQLLWRCALFVGNNSGPQHIAAGLGIPAIGIHSGVVDAHEWAPMGPLAVAVRRDMTCSPCYFALPEQCPRNVACLNELRPGDVLATCRRLLSIKGGYCMRNMTSPTDTVRVSKSRRLES